MENQPEKTEKENPFTQLCVWQGCLVGNTPGQIADFEKFMAENYEGTRIKYAEEVKTLPSVVNGKAIPDSGGRNDLLFFVHSEDLGKFAVPRLQVGIRWWEDVLLNGGGVLYPDEILEKYPSTWAE